MKLVSWSCIVTLLVVRLPITVADIRIRSPAKGDRVPSDEIFKVELEESGVLPLTQDIGGFVVRLYTGSNTYPVRLYIYDEETC